MGRYQGIQRSNRLPLRLPVCFRRPLIKVGDDQGNQEKEMQARVLLTKNTAAERLRCFRP